LRAEFQFAQELCDWEMVRPPFRQETGEMCFEHLPLQADRLEQTAYLLPALGQDRS
jgi:hypothetical protein